MRIASSLFPLAASAAAFALIGCDSGGGSGGTSGFRVISCSLGCTSRGTCSQNQVALNQEIKLRFNDQVDPGSVNKFSFSVIDASTGQEPTAIYAVTDSEVLFRPQITFNSNGNPVFGLSSGRDYLLNVYSSGSSSTGELIRSRSGKANSLALSCRITASQGVIDPVPGQPSVQAFLQQDPAAAPGTLDPLSGAEGVSVGSNVVLTFDDLMNPATLVNPVTGTSNFLQLAVDLDGNLQTTADQREVPSRFSIALNQVDLTTLVRIDPTPLLPGPGSDPNNPRLMVVKFLNGIRDLAGNTLANPDPLTFITEVQPGQSFPIVEDFDANTQEDVERTSGEWNKNGNGYLAQGPGGGSGLHGELRPTAAGVVVINTDNQSFPATGTLTGIEETVTNGVFYFSSIDIPRDVTVRFTGSRIVQIYCANANIRGTLSVAGENAPLHFPKNDPCPLSTSFPWISNDTGRGGSGGLGGPGGGNGGSGGDDPRPIAASPQGMPANPGSTARLAPEHLDGEPGQGIGGTGGVSNGGGGGSNAFPVTQISSDFNVRLASVELQPSLLYSLQRAAGAGGASNASVGTPGVQELPFTNTSGVAGSIPPGLSNQVPRTSVGGAGGGGGGVHPYFSNRIASRFNNCKPAYPAGSRPTIAGNQVIEVWNTGCGGGGGGGTAILQAGRGIAISGSITAAGGLGGSAASFGSTVNGTEAGSGGGGGSGGNIRVEATSLNLSGVNRFIVSGGTGGRSSLNIHGGNGGAGYVHARANPAPDPSTVLTATTPITQSSVGTYTSAEWDNYSRAESRYFSASGAFFIFEYLDFEVEYAVAGPNYAGDPNDPNQVTYVTLNEQTTWSQFPNAPFNIVFRGAEEDPATPGVPRPGTETRWLPRPGLLNANQNLFKWAIVFNRQQLAAQNIVAVMKVTVRISPN
ncbi:MAG: hypothetical protein IPN34_11890 [Planctomycetes bacterium]|nr:hypothetical protein [Planctomycetota bacterium]